MHVGHKVTPKDMVAVVIRPVTAGETITVSDGAAATQVTAVTDIPAAHKIALQDIAEGREVIKYGESIGRASAAIAAGSHVHIHNLEGVRGRGDARKGKKA